MTVSHFASEIGSMTLTFETGKLAQQAGGSVVLRYGDNVMLATATMSKPRTGIDFFPLSVDFEERMYARGKIPGSFFRREGRPSTNAILIARMTDRPVRPLFPKGFKNEVQVILTPLSSDQENPFEPLAIIGASAALSISEIPFEGPIGATHIGYVDGELVVNPTFRQLEESALDLLVVGSRDGVVMIEADGTEVSESLMLDAIEKAQEVNQQLIALQEEAVRAVGKQKASYESHAHPREDGRAGRESRRPPRGTGAGRPRLRRRRGGPYGRTLGIGGLGVRGRTRTGRRRGASGGGVPKQNTQWRASARRALTQPDQADLRRGVTAPPNARHGAVHQGRDADHGRGDPGLGGRRSEDRHAEPGRVQALHAALQLPSLLHRRGQASRLAGAQGDRTRRAG